MAGSSGSIDLSAALSGPTSPGCDRLLSFIAAFMALKFFQQRGGTQFLHLVDSRLLAESFAF